MLKHPNIEIKLNTDYKDIKGDFKRIFYTGPIDEFLITNSDSFPTGVSILN